MKADADHQRLRNRRNVAKARARRKARRASYYTEIDGDVLDLLVRRNYLGSFDSDRKRISDALSRFLIDLAHQKKL